MGPGVPAVGAVVTHHPEVVRGYDDVEGSERRFDTSAQVGRLVERNAVDHHRALVVTALDMVAPESDDSFHEVSPRGVEADFGQKTLHSGRLWRDSQPLTGITEHDHIAAFGATGPVGDLLDDDPVVPDELRNHRARRHEEHLYEERLDERGDSDRQH